MVVNHIIRSHCRVVGPTNYEFEHYTAGRGVKEPTERMREAIALLNAASENGMAFIHGVGEVFVVAINQIGRPQLEYRIDEAWS